MTIRKGQEWGTLVVPGPGMRTVHDDAELRELVVGARRDGQPLPVVGLLGGDMMRTVGGTADRSRLDGDEPIPHLPIDIVQVTLDDGPPTWFVSHLVARGRSWWRGPISAAMNAQFIGSWDISPRCHPNDGRIDLATVSPALGVQQRWLARKRLPLGTHVPHPLITIKQHSEVTVDLDGERGIWLDGMRQASARVLRITVEPDALVVCV
ncbi:MAG: hypothetical protein JWN39_3785 [Ilumatobacteraceae bacterium]|nr:hypothetical protein [Ilumatobacteraceae bacterium]